MGVCKGVPKSVPKGVGKSVGKSVPMCDGKSVRTGVGNIVGIRDGRSDSICIGEKEPRGTVWLSSRINPTAGNTP